MTTVTVEALLLLFAIFLVEGRADESPSATAARFGYFDQLHANPFVQARFSPNATSTQSNVAAVTIPPNISRTGEEETYRMVHLGCYSPLTNKGVYRSGGFNYIAGLLLATYHFNNKEESPLLKDMESLKDCNIRFTTELIDTRMDPVSSTTAISAQVLRPRVFHTEQPLPAGIIGAYRSATTAPLAIVSGVYGIPQMSALASSTDIDNKDQYPYFARSCTSTDGDARAAVDYYKYMETKFERSIPYVAVLFVRDAYGAALQKAFQDVADEHGIQTQSIPFPYDNPNDIPAAIEQLKDTAFRYFFVICFASHVPYIVEAAEKSGLLGDNTFWLFQGPDSASFQRQLSRYERGT